MQFQAISLNILLSVIPYHEHFQRFYATVCTHIEITRIYVASAFERLVFSIFGHCNLSNPQLDHFIILYNSPADVLCFAINWWLCNSLFYNSSSSYNIELASYSYLWIMGAIKLKIFILVKFISEILPLEKFHLATQLYNQPSQCIHRARIICILNQLCNSQQAT